VKLYILEQEAIQHAAVHHPYLRELSNGKFADMTHAIRDFSKQYYYYSEWFPRYINAVVSRLTNGNHIEALLQNLFEEQGLLAREDLDRIQNLGIEPALVDGIPHPQLYMQYLRAMKIDLYAPPCVEVVTWRESFLNYLQTASEPEIIGAIGLGTESVVKHLYPYIIKAIKSYTSLTPADYVFFPLHTEVDDAHGKVILQITEEIIANDEKQFEGVRNGMLTALELRANFWKAMKKRAVLKKSIAC
jgi:pyrroloquinoline quinone (PQQ) biosynthesis protein C